MKIEVDIPSDLEEYAPFMAGLLRLQVAKLYVNAHKATPERREIEIFIRRMREEIEELEAQLGENRLDGNGLLEIADIANFALLSFIALRNEQMEQKGNVTERSTLRHPGDSPDTAPRARNALGLDPRTHVGPGFEVVHSPNYPAPERGRTQLLRGDYGVEAGGLYSLEGDEPGLIQP